jgi:LysM repeat protein
MHGSAMDPKPIATNGLTPMTKNRLLKTTLWLAMLAVGLAAPAARAASDMETLRARCSDLQRQVRHLEAENAKLKAAKSEPASPDAKTPPPSAQTKDSVSPGAGKTHKVQQGETYASISKKYGVSVKSLVAANPAVKPTALRPGQVIHLSAHEPPTPSKPAVADTPPPATPKPAVADTPPPATPKPSAPAPPNPPVAASPPAAKPPQTAAPADSPSELASSPKPGQKSHAITITKEITYGEFASQHDTDIKRLNELNGLDLTKATVLAKGSELYVPAKP